MAKEAVDAERWRLQYADSLLRVDVLEFEQIQEALYIVFRVTPFSRNIARSLLKEPKIYFFDTGFVKGDNGARLENLVAVCLYPRNLKSWPLERAKNPGLRCRKRPCIGLILGRLRHRNRGDFRAAPLANFSSFLGILKTVFANVDYQAQDYSLKYLNTKEHHEVDFALIHNEKVEKIIEVKYADASASKQLRYFHDKYQLPATQVVHYLKREKIEHGIEIVSAEKFLRGL